MQKIQQTVKVIFLALGCSAPLAPIAKADHYHHHDIAFANAAKKKELRIAYLNKCNENCHLADALEEARHHHTNWKDIKKALGVGAVLGGGVVAIVWILTR